MLKGFKEFLARGNIVDLSTAVVIGTAFTGLVTAFTNSVVEPLISRIGAGGDADYGILRIGIGGGAQSEQGQKFLQHLGNSPGKGRTRPIGRESAVRNDRTAGRPKSNSSGRGP